MGKTGVIGSVSAFIILLGAASAAQAQAGPFGYWKGDDGSPGTTAADSSGFNHNGTYQSGAVTSATVPTLQFANTYSMSFNSAGAVVSAPTFSWPTGGPVTVAFWNNVTSAQVRNSSAFNVGDMDNPNRFHTHAPWGDSILYWDYGDINTTGRISTSYATYLNKWTHVALVSEGVGGAFKAIYLDGVLVTSAASSSGPGVALSGMNIGRWPGTGLDHQGLIDDFRIYDRVLTAAQISALASGLSEPAAPTGLTAAPGTNPGEIQLNWNAAPLSTGYILQRATQPGGPYTNIPLAGTSYLDTGLNQAIFYYYVVAAVNALGQSPNSAQAVSRPYAPPRTQVVGNGKGTCGCSAIPPPGEGTLWGLALAAALALAGRRIRG
ncbi:MAG: hypothetical protein HY293_13930 [Planctomycetes bacterium]|nr:hypothetical protein [Planctomycetota bacterium]